MGRAARWAWKVLVVSHYAMMHFEENMSNAGSSPTPNEFLITLPTVVAQELRRLEFERLAKEAEKHPPPPPAPPAFDADGFGAALAEGIEHAMEVVDRITSGKKPTKKLTQEEREQLAEAFRKLGLPPPDGEGAKDGAPPPP